MGKLLLFLTIGGIVTFASRVLPFLIFRNENIPSFVSYLGRVLPMAVMCILVLYCIKDISFVSAGMFLPQIVSIAVVAALYIWKKNSTMSIFAGTILYMILLRML